MAEVQRLELNRASLSVINEIWREWGKKKRLSHGKALLNNPAVHGNRDWDIYLTTMTFQSWTDFI